MCLFQSLSLKLEPANLARQWSPELLLPLFCCGFRSLLLFLVSLEVLGIQTLVPMLMWHINDRAVSLDAFDF